jgi:hypothetical protein
MIPVFRHLMFAVLGFTRVVIIAIFFAIFMWLCWVLPRCGSQGGEEEMKDGARESRGVRFAGYDDSMDYSGGDADGSYDRYGDRYDDGYGGGYGDGYGGGGMEDGEYPYEDAADGGAVGDSDLNSTMRRSRLYRPRGSMAATAPAMQDVVGASRRLGQRATPGPHATSGPLSAVHRAIVATTGSGDDAAADVAGVPLLLGSVVDIVPHTPPVQAPEVRHAYVFAACMCNTCDVCAGVRWARACADRSPI